MFGKEIAMNQTCYALAAKNERPFWLNCVFHSIVGALVHAAHGSVFDTITTTTISSARAVIPSASLFDVFEKQVAPLFSRMLHSTEEAQTLAATRDLLLPKLMSGELRVREAEREVEAVL